MIYRSEDDFPSNPTDTDQADVILTSPVEFIVGEELEYGHNVKNRQISIFVESGIYYEDLPIRVPENVTINGNDYRRVIIRPKERISQSRWANTYFYRDLEFDGLTGAVDNNLPVSGTKSQNQLGWYGRHYLSDPTNELNVSTHGESNVGKYFNAAELIKRNREFITEEVIVYTEQTYPAFTFNELLFRRFISNTINALVSDLITGGREQVLEKQGEFSSNFTIGSEFTDSITRIKTIVSSILSNSIFPKLGSVNQYTDTNLVAENNSDTTVNSLIDCILYAGNSNYNPPKNNEDLDCFLMNNSSVVHDVTLQSHGGFMMVLDPEASIRGQPPYCYTARINYTKSQKTNI